MADIKLTLVVACALVDADKRVLIAQRPAGKALAGLWEFPGGKLEPGERPEQTLIRELHEEIGITVSEPCLAPLTFASHAYDELSPADAALHLPALGRRRSPRAKDRNWPGSAPTSCATIRCRRRTSR